MPNCLYFDIFIFRLPLYVTGQNLILHLGKAKKKCSAMRNTFLRGKLYIFLTINQ